MEKPDCLRCQTPMDYICRERLQLGQRGLLTGGLPQRQCPKCGGYHASPI